MTFNPQPKPEPCTKAPRSRIPAVSERHDGGREWWAARSREVYESQGGICASCCKWRSSLDACHIKGLGRRATRYDREHPLNRMDNLIGLCRVPQGGSTCHDAFDRQSVAWRRAKAQEWKDRMNTQPGHGAQRTGGLR